VASELDSKVPGETVGRLDDDILGVIFSKPPKHFRETGAPIDWVCTAHRCIVILINDIKVCRPRECLDRRSADAYRCPCCGPRSLQRWFSDRLLPYASPFSSSFFPMGCVM
jgi:hypothetical protein